MIKITSNVTNVSERAMSFQTGHPGTIDTLGSESLGLIMPGYSPVPRLSFATRFDTKLREKSFEKQNSAKAVLFTMYVSTV